MTKDNIRATTMSAVKKRSVRRGPAAPASKRQIGRPDASADVVGPDALIDKTCELLAILQPSKVTRAEVARYAGVDPSLIRYYFQNRTKLLVAAAERMTPAFGSTFEQDLKWEKRSPTSKLTARMGALLELVVSHPFYHRLLTEELFTSDSPAAADLLKRMAKQGVGAYHDLVKEGVEEGTFNDVNSTFLFVAIVGMCDAFVSLAPILDIALGKSTSTQVRRRQYEEFLSELLTHGVTKPAKTPNT